MTYAIVRSNGTRLYRVVKLVYECGLRFGVTVDNNGKAGWQTYTSKAAALKTLRKLETEKNHAPRGWIDTRVLVETPFAPMTSALTEWNP